MAANGEGDSLGADSQAGVFLSAGKVLKKYGVNTKHSWGQNFLVEREAANRIVDAAALTKDDLVLEIGAGPATLTLLLAQRAGRVVAVERDREMAHVARSQVAHTGNVEIEEADALKLDLGKYLEKYGKEKLTVVGNLPYNIAGAILYNLLLSRAQITRMVLTFQLEVAKRIVAQPGGRDYGGLTVLVGQMADAKLVRRISPGAFLPPPKVWSGVVSFQMLPSPRHAVLREELFRRVVKSVFCYRRKTLRNGLLNAGYSDVDTLLKMAGLPGNVRPETLSVKDFAALANGVAQLVDKGTEMGSL